MNKIINFIVGLLTCISFTFAQQSREFGSSMSLYEVYEQSGPANGYDRYMVLDIFFPLSLHKLAPELLFQKMNYISFYLLCGLFLFVPKVESKNIHFSNQ